LPVLEAPVRFGQQARLGLDWAPLLLRAVAAAEVRRPRPVRALGPVVVAAAVRWQG